MKPKHQRLALLGLGVLVLGAAAALVLTAFEDNLVFFHSPTELATKDVSPQQRLRIGGLVAENSVVKSGSDVRFVVTDGAHSINVAYRITIEFLIQGRTIIPVNVGWHDEVYGLADGLHTRV